MRGNLSLAKWLTCWLCGFAFTLIIAWSPPLAKNTSADEPAQKFLNKLRENDYYDVALDYLDVMENSPLASPEFKERVAFEKAECLLLAATATRDVTQVALYLDRADQYLAEFAQSNPPARLAAQSDRVRARTLFGRGNLANIQAQSDQLTVAEKKVLHDQARDYFQRALDIFENSLQAQKEIVENFKVDTADPSSIERRDALRQEYIETRFMAPAIKEQIAETMAEGEPERKGLLNEAATEFADIATDYARFTRGSYARIAAARCYKKLGLHEPALSLLIEVLADNVPRSFKLDAAVLAIECWENRKPPGNADICGRIGDLADILAPRDIRDPKIAAVQLGYAKACRNYAEELSQSPNKDAYTSQINELRSSAAKYAGNVARGSNPLRETARRMLAEWNLRTVEPETSSGEPMNFAEAKEQAIALLDSANQLRQEIQTLAPQLETSGANRASLAADLQSKRESLRTSAEQSLQRLKLALQLATSEIPREEINGIRMRQAVANFFLENYYEAAVLGEYLLDRYPTVTGSREGAGVAMRAYLQLHLQAPESDRAFERSRLESICTRIMQKWPDEPGTDEAANILITLALQDAHLDRAMALVNTLEKGSSPRAKLETHMGRMAWNKYLTQSKDAGTDPAANQMLLTQAEELLSSGVGNLKPETLTLDAALGALNLAQLYLERDEIDKAIAQLENGPIGPLDVIKQKLPPASDPKFVRESYRTALQAYVSGMRQGQQSNNLLEKAHGIVVALRETTADSDPAQKDTLVAIYYQLARELLSQLDRLESPDEKASFAQNLATFMQSLREQATDAKTQMWVGSTLNSVADKLAESHLDKIAGEFRAQAVESLDAAANTGFGSDESAQTLLNELKRQKGIAFRGQGQFDEALQQFVELLRAKPALVNIQIDAAKTLQMRGDQKQDAESFAAAVAGSNKESLASGQRATNLVWGWRQLAMATKGKEQFSNEYFEALYNMSYCRLRYGEILNREDAKKAALSEIQSQKQQFPEMGGPNWKPKFEELARRIQKTLGQPTTGLD